MRGRLGITAILLLAACSDGPTNTDEFNGRPQALGMETVPHFFFLPPLAEGGNTGDFNGNLHPAVEVCHLVNDACAENEDLVAYFEQIGVSLTDEQYKVNWQIAGVTAGETYRISVLAAPGGSVLGSIDLLGTAGGGLSDPETGVSRNVGSTLPIKFRIEQGILCTTYLPDPLDEPCTVNAIGPDGGTVTNGLMGAYFPPGALKQWVTVVIEQYEPYGEGLTAACLPTYQPQAGMCSRMRTNPDLPNFEPVNGDPLSVTAGVCPDPAVFEEGIFDQFDLYKWDEINPSSLTYMPARNVEFLNCPGTPFYEASLSPSATSRFALAHRLLQPLLRLMGPAPLYAAKISPFGGGLNDFSRIGWLRPLALSVVDGDAQTAYVGNPVLEDPTVKVTAAGAKVVGVVPVANVPVKFQASGDGSAAPQSVLTNSSGEASVAWTLATTAGANTLTVQALNPWAEETATDVDNFPNRFGNWAQTTLTATGVALPPEPPEARFRVVFTSPLSKGKLTALDVNVPGVDVVVKVCVAGTTTCWDARRVVSNDSYHFQWQAPATATSTFFTFQVIHDGTVLGSFTGAVGKEGSKPPRPAEFVFQLGSKVQVKFVVVAK